MSTVASGSRATARSRARSMARSSCRTLPDQSSAGDTSRRRIGTESVHVRPGSARRSAPSASAGTSSRRSRSGGIASVTRGEAVVQILAEAPLAHRDAQVAVGGCDEAHARALRLGARVAERAVRAELREVEQELLRVRRQVEDLVEDEGPAVGELDEPDALRRRAGEGAALVAEELRGDRVHVVAGAEHGAHDRPATARLGDRLREERLAGARLAE